MVGTASGALAAAPAKLAWPPMVGTASGALAAAPAKLAWPPMVGTASGALAAAPAKLAWPPMVGTASGALAAAPAKLAWSPMVGTASGALAAAPAKLAWPHWALPGPALLRPQEKSLRAVAEALRFGGGRVPRDVDGGEAQLFGRLALPPVSRLGSFLFVARELLVPPGKNAHTISVDLQLVQVTDCYKLPGTRGTKLVLDRRQARA